MHLLLLAGLFTLCLAKPQFNPQYNQNYVRPDLARQQVPIVEYSNDISPDGSFAYSYKTGDGITAQEQGYLKNPGAKDGEAQTVQGSYSYVGDDGQTYSIRYTADEFGYRAEGAHLPVAPPIPIEIQKSLDLIARTQPGTDALLQTYRGNPAPQQQSQQYYNNQQYNNNNQYNRRF